MAAHGDDGDAGATRAAQSSPRAPRKRALGGPALLACCLSLVGCAGADGADEDGGGSVVSQPIRGGAVDSETTAVFAMAVQRSEGALSLCTATLIERNLFLTARHCLVDTPRVVRCGTSEFDDPTPPLAVALVNATELDEDALENAPVFHGVALYLPETPEVCGADIALVETEEQVPRAVATPLEPRVLRAARPGERYAAVGYGGTRDDGRGSGIRRSRQDLVVRCSGQCPEGIADAEFLGEVGTCEGDSGGPALDERDGVIGVLSRGAEDCTLPIYGSIAAWASLIATAAQSAAERGGYPAPEWSQGDFPPGPDQPEPPPSGSPGNERMSSDSGCAWHSAGPSGGAAPVLLGLALLGVTRRRRWRA